MTAAFLQKRKLRPGENHRPARAKVTEYVPGTRPGRATAGPAASTWAAGSLSLTDGETEARPAARLGRVAGAAARGGGAPGPRSPRRAGPGEAGRGGDPQASPGARVPPLGGAHGARAAAAGGAGASAAAEPRPPPASPPLDNSGGAGERGGGRRGGAGRGAGRAGSGARGAPGPGARGGGAGSGRGRAREAAAAAPGAADPRRDKGAAARRPEQPEPGRTAGAQPAPPAATDMMFPQSRHSGSSHLPQQLKFTTSDSCDRIKDEFQLLQAQYHSLKLECDKLASEKSEMQRHYVMAEIVKRLNGICAQVLPYLSQEHQQQVLGAIERAKQVTAPELNSIIRQQLQAHQLSQLQALALPLTPLPVGLQPPSLPAVSAGTGLLSLSALGSQAHLSKEDKNGHDGDTHQEDDGEKSASLLLPCSPDRWVPAPTREAS
uniref:Groucho/TLE N-terminal Q-rich domain-containing protein n=1 Tax=Callithrix jacchus TaxID=9483 RepID=F7I9V2_CALJA